MPLVDDFMLTQITVNLADSAKVHATLVAMPDDMRARGIDATFLNVQEPADMSEAQVTFAWANDQHPEVQGAEPFVPVDAEYGRLKVHYPGPMLIPDTTVTASIMVTQGDDQVIQIPLPTIQVGTGAIDPDALPSDDTFSMFAEALQAFKNGVEDMSEATDDARAAAGEARAAAGEASAAAGEARAAAGDVEAQAAYAKEQGDAAKQAAADAAEATEAAYTAAEIGEAAADRADEAARRADDGEVTRKANELGRLLDEANRRAEEAKRRTEEERRRAYQTEFERKVADGEFTGTPAGWGEVTATVDDTSGDPHVDVSAGGPDTARDIRFDFYGLVGPEGPVGPPGFSADLGGARFFLEVDPNGDLWLITDEGEPCLEYDAETGDLWQILEVEE